MVDHKDWNGLNNQKSNLRLCTNTQNQGNARKRGGCFSKYKGVSWLGRLQKWQAAIHCNKKGYYLGIYENEDDAAHAYNEAAKRLFGAFALPNIIERSMLN